jgi:uncharacterized protein YndB with AHSA1/START domain
MSNVGSRFLYVTYIRTTPAKLWEALTTPEFNRKFWFGCWQESEWKKGSPWAIRFSDGRVADEGEVLEIEPMKRLVLKWRNRLHPEMTAEGYTRCTMDIAEEDGGTVKLTITHEIDVPNAKIIEAVSGGWPKIMASLKSLLETGEALPEIHKRY